MSKRLRLGMVGGGPGASIGAVHRVAARFDDRYESGRRPIVLRNPSYGRAIPMHFVKPVFRVGPSRRDLCGKSDSRGKIKGRDIGYALAASSREGADSVDARTVTALWCDHCFHSSKLQLPLAESSVSGHPASCPAKRITQLTSEQQNF
jgi:hypothetical protein